MICVIVESPAKCKKIESYLGNGYKCIASYGHLRELKRLDQIENMEPKYSIISEEIKVKQIEKIRLEIAKCSEVILATDDDREGEAIAWHICQIFDLSIETTKRIIFHEITEHAIKSALLNPKTINMNLVKAQQARQMLDLLVGFNITPMLWNYISKNHTNSLSAGRCQTPTLQLVYDNYLELKNQSPSLVYQMVGYFTKLIIPFELNKTFEKQEDVVDFLENSLNHEHIFRVSEPKKVMISCPEPLITSSLQQLSSNELHLSPKETMKYAQQLYENGYITYMRTDCKTYAKEFIQHSKEYILREYNDEKYINEQLFTENETKTKDLAHEAIRPVSLFTKSVDLTTDKIDSKAIKLYHLIWKRTLESCMSSATVYHIHASITAYNDHIFQYKSEQILFPGWKIVSHKIEDNKIYSYLKTVKQPTMVDYTKIISNVSLKNSKNHYTEARLIHLLEEKGIGRPSTFATLIDKIQERSYVCKENVKGSTFSYKEYMLEGEELTETEKTKVFGNETNKLVIQPLGILVIEFLIKHFNELFHYDYTKQMEDELDLICQGIKEYNILCNECNEKIEELTNKMTKNDDRKDVNKKINKDKYEIVIDKNHSYIIGKYGPVIKKTEGSNNITFLNVKKTIDIKILEKGGYSLEDLLDDSSSKEKTLGKYQGQEIIVKKGKYGIYATWGSNKRSLQEFGNKPIDSFEYVEVIRFLEKDTLLNPECPVTMVRKINDDISIRTGKYGDYILYKNKKMKKPQFLKLHGFPGDYKTVNISILLEWLKSTHKI